MGARLRFAKVIDRELFLVKERGRLHPHLENRVLLQEEPGTAAAFLVIRGWSDDHGTFTERWKLEGPGGQTIYESLPREVHVATPSHTERLEDEIADLELDAASDDYTIVFYLDDREVARVEFPVVLDGTR
ncbi:MAG TPA: hypothetical protein VG408_03180 [Actinomycetota bacterium]|nr:hypothetical protein [Actinomycetota bacterium]